MYKGFKVIDIRFENIWSIIKRLDYSIILLIISYGWYGVLGKKYLGKAYMAYNKSFVYKNFYDEYNQVEFLQNLLRRIISSLGLVVPHFINIKGKRRKIYSGVAFIVCIIIDITLYYYAKKFIESKNLIQFTGY